MTRHHSPAVILRKRLHDAERDLAARSEDVALLRSELAAALDLEARLKLAEDRIHRTTTTDDYLADAATIHRLEEKLDAIAARAGQ